MTHFVRTCIVRWNILSLLLLSHSSARNSVCVPGRQYFTMPSFCFDMIMQKHPVVFACQWFRYFTGLLELAAGIGLLISRYAFYAAILLAIVMVARSSRM